MHLLSYKSVLQVFHFFFTKMKYCPTTSTILLNQCIHAFFISNTFISNARLKLAKNQVNAKQHPELNFCHLKTMHILQTRYDPKIIGHILKNKLKNKCVCFHEIIRLIIMKMKMKMKNRSHRYGINRTRSRHGNKYSKYKKCLSMMMLT